MARLLDTAAKAMQIGEEGAVLCVMSLGDSLWRENIFGGSCVSGTLVADSVSVASFGEKNFFGSRVLGSFVTDAKITIPHKISRLLTV